MRIAKPFGQRTETKREIVRKFYLIYEGVKTEVAYFEGVILYKNELKINSLVEIIPILRSYDETHFSNPQKILEILIPYLEENLLDNLTVKQFVDYIIDWLFEGEYISSTGIYNRDTLKNRLINILNSDDSKIIDTKKSAKTISDFLALDLGIKNSVEEIETYLSQQNVTYDPDYDRVCLIADRDRQSFKPEQYDEVLATCKDKGFSFYISNPCFEFWLLLHYDEVLSMDKGMLLKNPKDKPKAKKRFLEKQLGLLMGSYNKEKLDFSKLLDKVQCAIKNEKLFCEDIERLKVELGSNIGKLLESLQE